jgi:hypothetical protein
LSKKSKKPAKASQPPHVHGEYNGVMGKGSFTKKGDRYICVECGTELDALPEEWVKANPEGAKLLLKGQKNEGPKNPVMVEAGKKAWKTRKENQEKAKASSEQGKSSKKSSPKNAA